MKPYGQIVNLRVTVVGVKGVLPKELLTASIKITVTALSLILRTNTGKCMHTAVFKPNFEESSSEDLCRVVRT